MAKFSESFLQQLGRPGWSEGMFDLGQAIGGAQGQIRDQRKKQEFNQLMQQGQQAMASKDPAALSSIAQQLAAAGYQKEAQQLAQAAATAKEKARLQGVLSGADLQTPEGLGALSQYFKEEGDAAQAVEFASQQRVLGNERDKQNKFVERKVNLSNTALRLGQDDLANRIQGITDPEELRTVATEMRKTEIDRMPTQSPLVRKQMAEAAGLSADVFEQLSLAKVSDTVFSDLLTGQSGELEFFLKDGKVTDYRVNKTSGLIWDKDANKWSEASEIGLQPAPPQLQKVQNITAGMGDELAKVGAKSFAELAENAGKSAAALSTINRSLPTIDNMFTGAGAEVKLNIARYAEAMGLSGDYLVDPASIVDTEAYMANAGQRVAEYIVNLGAGTGLSDADREYAEAVVAGKITASPETLKRLLKELKQGAQNKINRYKQTRKKVAKSLGAGGEAALAWFPEDFYVDDGPATVRSPASTSFLEAAAQ